MARPRTFDKGVVLDRAMDVFWTRGYDGASMAELTEKMGINSPSIYAAFGNKRALFDQVVERYQERRVPHRDWMLAAASAREMAERMLTGAAEWLTTPSEPPGCLMVQCGLGSADEDNLSDSLSARRLGIVRLLSERFEVARDTGELPDHASPSELASYFYNVFCGLAVRAAAGTPRSELLATVRLSMLAWPAPARKTRRAS